MIEKFIKHGQNTFTIQDLMDDVGHEIQKLKALEVTGENVGKDIALLRMFKSDLRNIVRRYETIDLVMRH